MPVYQVLLHVPIWVAKGLASGQFERIGGVIREVASKKIVAWLREGGRIESNPDPKTALARFLFQKLLQENNLTTAGNVTQQVKVLSNLTGMLDVAGNLVGAANVIATARSHHLIMLRLQAIQNMLVLSTRLGMLNIALSGFGLLVMLKRFADIASLLDKVHEQVANAVKEELSLAQKINLSAALESANVVMEAEAGYFKESMAAGLDLLLMNAREHQLSDFHNQRHDKQAIESSQHLLAQAMHLDETRIRSYLEVGQIELANSVMQNLLKRYRRETRDYVDIILGKSHMRAVYFNKKVSESDLRRYLLIEQWLRGKEDILWDIINEKRDHFWDSDVNKMLSPPDGIVLPGQSKPKPPTGHVDALEQAGIAIENFQRFEGFALELESLSRLGISLHDWESMHNTGNTVFVNDERINLDEHDDYVLLVDRDYLESARHQLN